jgi:WD40 repeat protein
VRKNCKNKNIQGLRTYSHYCKKKIQKSKFKFSSNSRSLSDEIAAHSQKVTCLDIGETGRVLVTGGSDRLVNLFAIGNNQSIQVSRETNVFFSFIVNLTSSSEKKKERKKKLTREVKFFFS